MADLLTVELKNLRFFAYHGLYAEEQLTGNEFELNITVSYTSTSGIITDLEETVNYVRLHELAAEAMKKPRPLLETVAMELAADIHQHFPSIKQVTISIDKLCPPIVRFTGKIGVRFSKQY